MRILAIRGRNIASLAESFEIDFEAEPLRSAGLFAITGETGAGKSSILDAMCLALYGTCPRLSATGTDEDVPDAAKAPLRSKDPRSCLRRGAAEGFAEVEFLGLDGRIYRAHWSARRARNKPDGALQTAARSLSERDGDAVAAGKTREVDAEIVARTGLAYDEFRRTVLLAQGEFDAFMRANESERATLLEKITGAEIYRAISRRAFERCAEQERAIAEIETRRGEHKPKSDDERAALEAEGAALTEAIAAQTDARRALEIEIALNDAALKARDALDRAREHYEEALRQSETLADERARFARLERVEPLRADHRAREDAREAWSKAETALEEAQRRATESETAAQTAQDAAAAAREALLREEERFKSFGPIWDQASDLDTDIRNARREGERAEEEAQRAAKIAGERKKDDDNLKKRLAQAQEQAAAAKDALARLSGVRALAEREDEIAGKLRDHAATRKAQTAAQDAQADAQSAIASADAALGDGEAALAETRRKAEAARATRDRLREDLNALREQDRRERESALVALDAALAAADQAAARCLEASRHGRAAREEESGALAAQTQARDDRAAAEREEIAAKAAAQALAAPLQRAEAAASKAAAALRAQLAPGEACPVCGATDHPAHDDGERRAEADALKREAAAAQADLARAQAAILRAKTSDAQAQALATQARKNADQAQQQEERARSDYAKARDEARRAAARIDVALALPDQPDAATDLAAARDEAARDLAATREALSEARRLRASLEAEENALAAFATTLESAAAALDRHRAARAQAERDAALAEQKVETAAQALAAGVRDLDALLAPAGLALAELEASQNRLADLVAKWRAAARAAEETATEANDLAQQSLSSDADARNAAAQAAAAREAAEARKGSLAELLARRAPLLDGEPTDSHRTRINAARLDAQKAQGEAQSAAAIAQAQAAAARTALDLAAKARIDAQDAFDGRAHRFADRVAQAALDMDQALALLATPPEDVAAVRGRLEQAADRVTRAKSALDQRAADLVNAEAALAAPQPLDELRTRRDEIDRALGESQTRRGAIRLTLDEDDALRKKLAGFDAELDAARATAKVWAAINAAIGSKAGDKFARIAQGVTLDMLVELANARLAELKPRYRLLRAPGELALHIEDVDMGGDLRSTRSLSGGERFLVSLALALALSGLGGRKALASTLFIDEGFGSLDSASLDIAIDALETLQSQGRAVGVISHVEAMKDRIPVQIRVSRQGPGRSRVEMVAPGPWSPGAIAAE